MLLWSASEREKMKINIEHENNLIKKADVELSPVEFMLFRHILNLAAIHTELHEVDSRLAIQMYRELEEQLNEVAK